ncbi:hypothetical protein K1F50_17120 [Muricauda oceani]|uniref:Uncharacterized protein n=1 Tax=Flagellimonas oceani TaxID=2698672 RepID=A0A6G7J5F7_9FLAO|nr:hypothetical protein [Allomuricauda oceani]MBW8244532.1 hypothetical protein [Allomuricauda oceani]QII45818.1 hypothetical protein GVT53_14420 [Allomuricauda oceani]
MFDKSQIVHLIQQDLKHSQLTEALRNLGLDDHGLYSLDLMSLVAELMQVPPEQMEHFTEIYGSYLDKAVDYPITYLGEHLLPVAEACYRRLLGGKVD